MGKRVCGDDQQTVLLTRRLPGDIVHKLSKCFPLACRCSAIKAELEENAKYARHNQTNLSLQDVTVEEIWCKNPESSWWIQTSPNHRFINNDPCRRALKKLDMENEEKGLDESMQGWGQDCKDGQFIV